MMLDEFAHQASRSIRAHHASFDCVPCHCIAFVDVVGLGSNILYNFIHIINHIYIYVIINLQKTFLMVAGYMACPSWSIRQNTARYRRLSRSMLKHCFAKVRADEASGHQLVVWQILAVYIICTGDYIVCGCCICAKVQPKFLLLAIVSI